MLTLVVFDPNPVDTMTFLTRLRDRYLNASVRATAHYMKTWAYCAHCATHTPWMTRAAIGHYQCLECGKNPLNEPAASCADHADTDASESPAQERAPRRGSAPSSAPIKHPA